MAFRTRTALENEVRDVLKDGRPRTIAEIRPFVCERDADGVREVVRRTVELHQMVDGRVILVPAFVDGLNIVVTPAATGAVGRGQLTLLTRRFHGWAAVPLTVEGVGDASFRRAGGWRLCLPPTTAVSGAGAPPEKVWVATSGPEGIRVRLRAADLLAQQVLERVARRTPDPAPESRSPLEFQLHIVARDPQLLRRTAACLGSLRRISARHRRLRATGHPGDHAAA